MPPFIHPQALVETDQVGDGTRIWAFAHLLPGCVVGRDCNICDHTFIEGGVRIGDRVTIKSGVYLWEGTEIEDDVFVGPNATFTNDRRPRSRRRAETYTGPILRRSSSIGAAAVLLPAVEIGAHALIGAGAVVTRSVPPQALVVGVPGRVVGWVCPCGQDLPGAPSESPTPTLCEACRASGDGERV